MKKYKNNVLWNVRKEWGHQNKRHTHTESQSIFTSHENQA
jgi:hypothetical protein